MKSCFAILLAGALTCWAGCSRKDSKAATAPPEVLVSEVVQKDVPVIKEWVATLNDSVNAVVTARIAGYLISQNYKEGSAVKKGDLLFQIDPRPFVDAQAKATLAKNRACASQGRAG